MSHYTRFSALPAALLLYMRQRRLTRAKGSLHAALLLYTRQRRLTRANGSLHARRALNILDLW